MTLKISLRVPHRNRLSRARGKDARMVVLPEIPMERLSKLNAHWYESLFIALSLNSKNQVVQVHILTRQAQNLAYPQAAVKGRKRHGMRPSFITPDGLPASERAKSDPPMLAKNDPGGRPRSRWAAILYL